MSSSHTNVSAGKRSAVRDWILDKAFSLESIDEVVNGLGECLNGIGMQVDRITFHCRALDPEAAAATVEWRAAGLRRNQRHAHGVSVGNAYTQSPIYIIDQGQPSYVADLRSDDFDDMGILHELKAQDFTGYAAYGCEFSGRKRTHIMTFGTQSAQGFTDDCFHMMREISNWITPALETRFLYDTGRVLMSTYLGRKTGARVLDGMIVRGTVDVIDSVIWMADLRGFTKLSQQFSPEIMVELLNDFFDAVISPVEDCGGEVLKLIGDGVLAIFPLKEKSCQKSQRQKALQAASSVVAEVDRLSTRWQNRLDTPLRVGIGLHAGEVAYGNIGSHDRLDFTVIGEAVNLASRLCDQCAIEKLSVLMSEAFLRDLEDRRDVTALEPVVLKGFDTPQPVYAAT